jgi:hypothetical protein
VRLIVLVSLADYRICRKQIDKLIFDDLNAFKTVAIDDLFRLDLAADIGLDGYSVAAIRGLLCLRLIKNT